MSTAEHELEQLVPDQPTQSGAAPEPNAVVPSVAEGVYFTTPAALPRGRHTLTREQVSATHRERLLIAATELLAAAGYPGTGVREVCARANVSRAAFYQCFTDKDACLDAAYDRFISVIIDRLVAASAPGQAWGQLVHSVLHAYLQALQDDLVVARAFQVEMDGRGKQARVRRRQALTALAELLRTRRSGSDAAEYVRIPLSSYVAAVYAVRQIAADALDEQDEPDLLALLPETTRWAGQLLA